MITEKDLLPVINWLKNGCDPLEAAKELELILLQNPTEKSPSNSDPGESS